MKCWICNDEGTTGEHRIKRSDLLAVFGRPTQQNPIYYHSESVKNLPIGSLNAKRLKSPSRICTKCNNSRTQAYDMAWERMSNWLHQNVSAKYKSKIIRENRVFPYNTKYEMRNVHLYFVKIFGCYIMESSIPIEIKDFSEAILEGKPHPQMFLRFGRIPLQIGKKRVASSDITAAIRNDNGKCAFASWFYHIDQIAINLMFAEAGERREGLVNAWHPRFGTNRLRIFDF